MAVEPFSYYDVCYDVNVCMLFKSTWSEETSFRRIWPLHQLYIFHENIRQANGSLHARWNLKSNKEIFCLHSSRWTSPRWYPGKTNFGGILGLCKFMSSRSGRIIGRFIPWTGWLDYVQDHINTVHHCEFSSLNSCRFFQRFTPRLAWRFLVINLKGSLNLCTAWTV